MMVEWSMCLHGLKYPSTGVSGFRQQNSYSFHKHSSFDSNRLRCRQSRRIPGNVIGRVKIFFHLPAMNDSLSVP
jgi:hypothetical protein